MDYGHLRISISLYTAPDKHCLWFLDWLKLRKNALSEAIRVRYAYLHLSRFNIIYETTELSQFSFNTHRTAPHLTAPHRTAFQ